MISPSTLETAANVATAAAEALAGGGAAWSPSTSTCGAALAADTAAHFVAGGAASGLAKPARPRTAKTTARPKASSAGYAAAKTASSSSARASATAKSKSSSSGTKTTGALSFISDPKLSIEEKLFRLMAYLQNKYEKELEKKMKEMAGADTAKASTSTASKASTSSTKSNGFLSAVVEGVKTALPAAGIALDALKNPTVRSLVKDIGGPVLAAGATALGFPELAPALLKYGPQLVDLAAGAVAALDDAAAPSATPAAKASASTSTASSGSTSSTSSSAGPKSEQVQMMELQRLVNQQNEMFAMISNVMKSWHETRSAVIANLR